MDSKYACINGGPSTPQVGHKFSLKRKWNGNSTGGNTPSPFFKKQFNANNGHHNNGAGTPHKQQQHQQTNGQSPNGTNKAAVPQLSLMDQRRALPVFQVRPKLMQAIAKNHTLIVLGETGSGKTTQIPQFLCDAGYAELAGRQIAVTQPRRVAAITLATRVAQEAGCRLGERVGYTVRFEDCTSARTKIKYMTDGTLLREALGDRLLRRYSVIVLDEAHERTINTDVLFGIIKAAQKARAEQPAQNAPLRVLIMSATMDVDHFARYFGRCECVYLQGRAHPVQVLHAREAQPEYTHACVSTLFDIHKSAPANHDVLIFLTGQEEIEHTATQIRTIAKSPDMLGAPRLLVHTLYSQQSQQKQMDVFRTTAPGARKVILCTNIAETSLTIRGIRYVIDSGRVKRAAYNPLTGMDTLRVERIAQDQAWQRTGRAGREAAGHCYRVYPMTEYKAMPASTQPEILRSSIVVTVLQLAAIGIDCAGFDFLDKPDAAAVAVAMRALHALGALASPTAPATSLTAIGRQMARFPLDPRFSRMLLAAPALGCLDAMLSIVAVLSGETVFVEPPVDQEARVAALQAHAKFDATHGDHQTLLNVFRAFEASAGAKMWCSQNWLSWRNLNYAREVRAQLRAICVQLGLMEEGAVEKKLAPKKVKADKEEGDDEDDDEDDDDDEAADAAAAIDADAEDEAVRRCLLAGLFANVAELTSDGHTYKTRGPGARQRVKIHPTSRAQRSGRPPCVLYTELIVTGQCYMRHVTAVEAEWLPEGVLQQQQHQPQQTGKRS